MSANVKNRSTILEGINLQFNFTFWVCRLHNNLWRIPSYGSGFQIIISVTCQKSTTKNIFVIDRGDTLKDLCDSSFICVFLQANDILFLNRILIQSVEKNCNIFSHRSILCWWFSSRTTVFESYTIYNFLENIAYSAIAIGVIINLKIPQERSLKRFRIYSITQHEFPFSCYSLFFQSYRGSYRLKVCGLVRLIASECSCSSSAVLWVVFYTP